MGFGGSAQAMITILKNNDKLRSKRQPFKKQLGGYGKRKKTTYDFPKADKRTLYKIRQRMRAERKKRTLKITLVMVGIITLMAYLFFSYV